VSKKNSREKARKATQNAEVQRIWAIWTANLSKEKTK
jgi:hypothetical protein